MELTPLQQRALLVPLLFDVFLGGGRGGGKTFALLMIAWVFIATYAGSRVVFFRQSYPSLHDAVLRSVEIFGALDPGATFNKSDLCWTFSNGSTFQFAALSDLDLYRRWQGQEFQLAIFEELQQWADPILVDMLLSNLRSSKGFPTRAVYAANPGDRGHHWIFERFLKARTDGVPFTTAAGRQTVTVRSTFEDNPNLPPEYIENLKAACAHDPALFEMWKSGDWSVTAGAAFSEVLNETNRVYWYPGNWYYRKDWRFYLALDWGTAHPAHCCLLAKAKDSTYGPDDEMYCRNDIVVVDECHTAMEGDLNKGDRSTVAEFSAKVKAMTKKWSASNSGCGDDAIFAEHGHGQGSLAMEFNRAGLAIQSARKGKRTDGWATLKNRFAAARLNGQREDPAVYLNSGCQYLWDTLPNLVPDPKNREDIETNGPDHGADSLRYGVTFNPPTTTTTALNL